MARKGLSMRKVREILRLRWGLGLSVHKVAKSCKVSPSTVLEYEHRAQVAGVSWPLPEGMDDMALEQRVCAGSPAPTDRRALPDLAYLLEEMRKPHVTLMLLWMEYKAAHPEGYQYTQFWRYYQEGKGTWTWRCARSIGRERSSSATTAAIPSGSPIRTRER